MRRNGIAQGLQFAIDAALTECRIEGGWVEKDVNIF